MVSPTLQETQCVRGQDAVEAAHHIFCAKRAVENASLHREQSEWRLRVCFDNESRLRAIDTESAEDKELQTEEQF
jgi:hypothetical protein